MTTYEKDSSSFPKKICIQIALQSVKSEMPKESSLWKPYKYIQRWWVPYGSDKWNPLLWISGSSLKQNTIGWIWYSWNKALIAWPNNTLNPLSSRHFNLCQIGFGMWTNILEPDSHMHSLLPGSKLDTLGNCINSFRPPGNLMLTKRKAFFRIKTSHSI